MKEDQLYVTAYKKTRHMGFFANIEIGISIVYITLGLTDRPFRFRDTTLFVF